MKKFNFKLPLKELFTNRHLTVLSIITALLALSLVVYIAIKVRPSDLQLITHYAAYGVTHLYRDQWFYLYAFAAFAVLAGFFNIALSTKIYIEKGSPLAIIYAWSGIGVLIFAWVTAMSIINVWSPL